MYPRTGYPAKWVLPSGQLSYRQLPLIQYIAGVGLGTENVDLSPRGRSTAAGFVFSLIINDDYVDYITAQPMLSCLMGSSGWARLGDVGWVVGGCEVAG